MSTNPSPAEQFKADLKAKLKKDAVERERAWLRKKLEMSDDDLHLLTHLERTTRDCVTVTFEHDFATSGRPDATRAEAKRSTHLAKAAQFVKDNKGQWPSQSQVADAAGCHWQTLRHYMNAHDLEGTSKRHALYLKARQAESKVAKTSAATADPMKRAKGGNILNGLAAPESCDPAVIAQIREQERQDMLQHLMEEQRQDDATNTGSVRRARHG